MFSDLVMEAEKKSKILTDSEIAPLYLAAMHGDEAATEALFWSVARMILAMAKKYGRDNPHVRDDCVGAGIVGFMRCVRSGDFDPRKGKWSTYIGWRISGAMREYVNRLQTTIRTPATLSPREARICHTIPDGFDIPCDPDPPEIDAMDETQSVLSVFSGREREMVEAKYIRGETLQTIGNRYGLSRERVRQLIESALEDARTLLS